jgi:catechol 2,3-dioxygenase-like lactoylglutathione lyase family enzyme
MIRVERLTHWSIPVRDIDESDIFYRDFLGLEYCGRLGRSSASVYRAGETQFILWETGLDADPRLREAGVHYAFTLLPEIWDSAVGAIRQAGLELHGPIVYRAKGTFLGREIYVLDPSGNVIELTDPTWSEGMPEPSYEEIADSARTPDKTAAPATNL